MKTNNDIAAAQLYKWSGIKHLMRRGRQLIEMREGRRQGKAEPDVVSE